MNEEASEDGELNKITTGESTKSNKSKTARDNTLQLL